MSIQTTTFTPGTTPIGSPSTPPSGVSGATGSTPDLTPTQTSVTALPTGDTPPLSGHIPTLNSMSAANVGPSAQMSVQHANVSGNETHPHLNDSVKDPVRQMVQPQTKTIDPAHTDKMLKQLSDGVAPDGKSRLAEDGTFNLVGLKTANGEAITPKMLKEANLSIKIFKDNNGEFQYKVSGKCGETAAKCLDALQTELNRVDRSVKGANMDPNYKPEFNLMADTVRNISPADSDILGRGGQIQYRAVGDQIVKLTLDPGTNGRGDALSVDILDHKAQPILHDNPQGMPESIHQTIPLSVVFEGSEFNGHKALDANGQPLLSNWRNQQLFEKSALHEEKDYWTHELQSTNVGDTGRLQAQNSLWNAVENYLKLSFSPDEYNFEFNSTPPANTPPTDESVLNFDPLDPDNFPDFETVQINPELVKVQKNLEPLLTSTDPNTAFSRLTWGGYTFTPTTGSQLNNLLSTVTDSTSSPSDIKSAKMTLKNMLGEIKLDRKPLIDPTSTQINDDSDDSILAALGTLHTALVQVPTEGTVTGFFPPVAGKTLDDTIQALNSLLGSLGVEPQPLGPITNITIGDQQVTIDDLTQLRDLLSKLQRGDATDQDVSELVGLFNGLSVGGLPIATIDLSTSGNNFESELNAALQNLLDALKPLNSTPAPTYAPTPASTPKLADPGDLTGTTIPGLVAIIRDSKSYVPEAREAAFNELTSRLYSDKTGNIATEIGSALKNVDGATKNDIEKVLSMVEEAKKLTTLELRDPNTLPSVRKFKEDYKNTPGYNVIKTRLTGTGIGSLASALHSVLND